MTNVDRFTNRFHVDYSRDVFKQLSLTLRYDNDFDTYSGVDFLEDSILNRMGIESNYSITPETSFLFVYDFTTREFQGGDDASINTVTTGIRQYITRKIYFDGKAGLSFIDTFNDESLIRPALRQHCHIRWIPSPLQNFHLQEIPLQILIALTFLITGVLQPLSNNNCQKDSVVHYQFSTANSPL